MAAAGGGDVVDDGAEAGFVDTDDDVHDDGERKVEKAIGSQDQPVQFGSCAFGVQAQGTDGNVDFHIGVQDIVDIITDSVRQFGGLGRMVLRGVRSGDETVNGQQVEWELYLY